MPEVSAFRDWSTVTWDNMNEYSGTSVLERRPYYFRQVGTGETAWLILISAVPSKTQPGLMHATDYLRLDRRAFEKLAALGAKVFGG